MNFIYSLSGGKDSTAMVLMAIERKEPIHSIVFFDTGWEFQGILDHIDLLEKRTHLKIWHLQSQLPFDYWLTARPVIARKGPEKGQLYKIGNGWPSLNFRWCTRQKVQAIDNFCKPVSKVVQCVGYANDEKRNLSNPKFLYRFPLQEYGITEAEALQYCYNKGYYWNGLYEHFRRVSCFCCPLQRSNDLKILRKHYPELWQRMLNMDKSIPNNQGFKGHKTVHDFDKRFANENSQQKIRLLWTKKKKAPAAKSRLASW